jgi:diguanylate cyclase (GGDEF)-like protein
MLETPRPREASQDVRARFELAVQKSRAIVYALAVLLGLVGRIAGAFPFPLLAAPAYLAISLSTAALFHEIYRRGMDRRWRFNPAAVWLGIDVVLISWAVALSGGIASPWFIWYLADTFAAAFAEGAAAAVAVAAINAVAYVAVLLMLGQVTGFDHNLALAVSRLAFLYAAAFFFLRGLANLQKRRRTIQGLKESESVKVIELTRLARELDQRTRELDRANERLREVSVTDLLTGLRNRRFLEEHIGDDLATVRRAYGIAKRGRTPDPRNVDLGFLMVDLDRFKEINDTHGHESGDMVLRQVADIFRGCLRENDAAIRWGGEEFLLLARQVNRQHVADVGGRVLREVRAANFDIGGRERISMTCSVGWSFYPFGVEDPEIVTWEEMVRLADAALYIAKNAGRNLSIGIVPADERITAEQFKRCLGDLREALRGGAFRAIGTDPGTPVPLPPDTPRFAV